MKRWYVPLAALLLIGGIVGAKPITNWSARTAFGLKPGDSLEDGPAPCRICNALAGANRAECYRLQVEIKSSHGTFKDDHPLCADHLSPTHGEVRTIITDRQLELRAVTEPSNPFYRGIVTRAIAICPPLSAQTAGEREVALR